jgi:hypothetical protein
VTRRQVLLAAAVPLVAAPLSAATPAGPIRGKLTRSPDGKPALRVDNQLISLAGDEDTTKVIEDSRLAGDDFEVVGHYESPDHVQIDPITSRAMFVHKDDKRLLITYWCDVCYIRTYSPGKCVCCQKYTDLDLREHDEP